MPVKYLSSVDHKCTVVLKLAYSFVGLSARTGVAAVVHAYKSHFWIRVATLGMYAQPR